MTRFLLTILVALSLIGAPGPALAGPAMGCTMDGASGMDGDHDKMACCTPDCAIGCPAGVVPGGGPYVAEDEIVAAPLIEVSARALPSVGPGATDPPPRTISL